MSEGLKAHLHIRPFSALVFSVKWSFAIVEEQRQSMWKKKEAEKK